MLNSVNFKNHHSCSSIKPAFGHCKTVFEEMPDGAIAIKNCDTRAEYVITNPKMISAAILMEKQEEDKLIPYTVFLANPQEGIPAAMISVPGRPVENYKALIAASEGKKLNGDTFGFCKSDPCACALDLKG
ncbi:MAG TPA: hypothetical protein P5556_05085 [Candidatus Gastranaerophilales bacterium]|nr:hypothetical protein [Candidatus Gastranaerophilales bacterium]